MGWYGEIFGDSIFLRTKTATILVELLLLLLVADERRFISNSKFINDGLLARLAEAGPSLALRIRRDKRLFAEEEIPSVLD